MEQFIDLDQRDMDERSIILYRRAIDARYRMWQQGRDADAAKMMDRWFSWCEANDEPFLD
jgi:hypothetical protein